MYRHAHTAYVTLGLDRDQGRLARFDLASWGIEDVAYVKPITVKGVESYGIFAADGTELTTVDNRDEAIVTIRQNELEAFSVH
ncbi:MAG: DUF1150 family protein [Alphaproteobacteria bacterium]|nr:DUF1150 family protein [Alphaproteobacteria bacterium]MBF0250335.1 DUF1150 family protein [Alphaproteobacteria bacterium]